MSWTIACFCGDVYAAPPDRCPTCGASASQEPALRLSPGPGDDGPDPGPWEAELGRWIADSSRSA